MSINKFITNLDLSRQAEILSGETAVFQGGIELGIPFSGFPSGVDTSTIVSLGVQEIEYTAFSGGSGTTLFDVVNPSSPYYSVSAATLSASPYTIIDVNTITETVSATTYPTIMTFTALSGDCCSTPISVSFTPPIIQELYDRGLYDGLFNGLGQATIGTTYIDESFYNVGSVFSGANLDMEIIEYGVHGSNPSWSTGTTSGTVIEYSALTQYWVDPIYENLTSGLTLPISPISAETQTSDYVWTLTDSTIIDDNLIGLQYTGYNVTYSFDNVIDDPATQTYIIGGVTATLEYFSAGTLDYKNSIEWLKVRGNATIDERLTTDRLTIHTLGTGSSVTMLGVDVNGNVVGGSGASNPNLSQVLIEGNTTGANTIEYSSDLSGSYTNRSLVDKEYVDNQITGVTDDILFSAGTGTNSITNIGDGSNVVTGSYSFSMGKNNEVNGYYSSAMGKDNNVSGDYSSAIGQNNTVDSFGSHILSDTSSIYSIRSGIFAGTNNIIKLTAQYSVILGGSDNNVYSTYSGILGGSNNNIGTTTGGLGSFCTILGGVQNTIGSNFQGSSIIGGLTNEVNSNRSAILGGQNNIVSGAYGVILGGDNNTVTNQEGSIIGGNNNTVTANRSSIIGGRECEVTQQDGGVLGGVFNTVSGQRSAIIGGSGNTVGGEYSAILGGGNNVIDSALRSVILGGQGITATTDDTVYMNKLYVTDPSKGNFYTSLDNAAGAQTVLSGTSDSLSRMAVTSPNVGNISLGVRGESESGYPGYGKVGDGYIYSTTGNNGINIISAASSGTDDYIKFYAGQDATSTSDLMIVGSGSSRGNVGIGTDTPTEKLDVNGNTIVSGTLNIGTLGGGSSVNNLGIDASGNVVSANTGSFLAAKSPEAIVTHSLTAKGIPDGQVISGYTSIFYNNTDISGTLTTPFGTFDNTTGLFTTNTDCVLNIQAYIHLKANTSSTTAWETGATPTQIGLGICPNNTTDVYVGDFLTILPSVSRGLDITTGITLRVLSGTTFRIKVLNQTSRAYPGAGVVSGDYMRFSITRVD